MARSLLTPTRHLPHALVLATALSVPVLAAALSALMLAAPAAAQAQPAAAASAPGALAVKTAPFAQLALRPQREAAAVVVARNDSRIAAEVAGTVQRWGPDTGARVAAGALLVEIDPSEHRLARERAAAALAAAQARAQLAAAQLQRARELQGQGFVSADALAAREAEARAAEADVAVQRAALASAERALAKTRVLAPFEASVRQRLVQAGETVAPGAPLYQLTETRGAELAAQLAPEDARGLPGAAGLQFARDDGSRVALKLLRVADTVNAGARTVEVRLAPASGALTPGRDGRLLWADPRPHVPAALLVRRDGRLGVFSEQGGRARFVPLPEAQEGRAAPAPQLDGALKLVIDGQHKLRDGDALAVR